MHVYACMHAHVLIELYDMSRPPDSRAQYPYTYMHACIHTYIYANMHAQIKPGQRLQILEQILVKLHIRKHTHLVIAQIKPGQCLQILEFRTNIGQIIVTYTQFGDARKELDFGT